LKQRWLSSEQKPNGNIFLGGVDEFGGELTTAGPVNSCASIYLPASWELDLYIHRLNSSVGIGARNEYSV
jgi:hypothetical protein